ncbi:MAG: formylmethanofuran dehydrogenase subunit B [Isosphaeraceae bacterium]
MDTLGPSKIPADPPDPSVLHVVCPACGCLCDDGSLTIAKDRIIAFEALCPKGLAWFQVEGQSLEGPGATINGIPSSLESALDRVVELLRRSVAPILLGLNLAGIETQRVAVALADCLKARVHLGGSLAVTRAFQNVGRVSSTLGEIKQRAEIALFWFVDPVSTHPRFLERFFGGVPKCKLVVVDQQANATAAFTDRLILISPGNAVETIQAVRARLAGIVPIDPIVEELAEMIDEAAYGVMFYDSATLSQVEAEEIFLLTRELNGNGRRFVAMELGSSGNSAGADAVLTWQTGYSSAVDFSTGHPRPFLGDWADTDLALVVSDDFERFSLQLKGIPSILISPNATAHCATVAIRTRTPCLNADETIVRADGVWLPVRAPFPSELPTDRQLLDEILKRSNRADCPIKDSRR